MGPSGDINNSVYVNPFDPGREGRKAARREGEVGSKVSREGSSDLGELLERGLEVEQEGELEGGMQRSQKHSRTRQSQVTTATRNVLH